MMNTATVYDAGAARGMLDTLKLDDFIYIHPSDGSDNAVLGRYSWRHMSNYLVSRKGIFGIKKWDQVEKDVLCVSYILLFDLRELDKVRTWVPDDRFNGQTVVYDVSELVNDIACGQKHLYAGKENILDAMRLHQNPNSDLVRTIMEGQGNHQAQV